MNWFKKHPWPPTLGFLCFAFLLFLNKSETICYFKSTTGIPCPGCGLTRAYLQLFHGHIREAFIYHPLFLLPILIAFLLAYQWRTKKKGSTKLWVFLCILIMVVYAVRMFLYFPNTPPMDFYPEAILPKLVSFVFQFFKRIVH